MGTKLCTMYALWLMPGTGVPVVFWRQIEQGCAVLRNGLSHAVGILAGFENNLYSAIGELIVSTRNQVLDLKKANEST